MLQTSYSHLVFRASGDFTPFSNRERAVFFWNQLRHRMKSDTLCLALVLMPNHGHLIVASNRAEEVSNMIHLSILAFKRKFSSFGFWDPTPPPRTIEPSLKHLQRQIRYVHLNPCRSNLVQDPLKWEFSTHRDYLGYTVDTLRVPKVLKLGFRSEAHFHKYVSSDPCASLTGTPLPAASPLLDLNFPLASLHRIQELSLRLTRSESTALEAPSTARRLFLALALAAGYRNNALMARYLKIRQQSVSEFLRKGRAVPYSREIARRLLCDPRF